MTHEDVKPEKYGYTRGCRSCDNIMRTGKSDVGHNTECRERVFRLMERDESVRVKDYRNRVQEAAAKQPQVPQQQAAATAEQQQLESSTQEVESRKRESVSGEVPESPSKRPVPASQWEQEGHGRYRKRQAEVPAEVLQAGVRDLCFRMSEQTRRRIRSQLRLQHKRRRSRGQSQWRSFRRRKL